MRSFYNEPIWRDRGGNVSASRLLGARLAASRLELRGNRRLLLARSPRSSLEEYGGIPAA